MKKGWLQCVCQYRVVKGKNLGNTGRYTKTIITAANTLTRQQDNDDYQSKQSSISAGDSFTFGSMTDHL